MMTYYKKTTRSNAEQNVKCRYYGFDLLRALSAFIIIGAHLSIQTTDIASQLMRYTRGAVGLFAALSGFLLALALDNETGWIVIRKRIARLLPLHVFWTIFYIVALSFLSTCFNSPPGYTEKMSFNFLVKAFLRGSAEIHLWFLSSLLYSSIAIVALDSILPNKIKKLCYIIASAAALFISSSFNSHFADYDIRLLGFLLLGAGLYHIRDYFTMPLIKKTAVLFWFFSFFSYWIVFDYVHGNVLDFVLVSLTIVIFGDTRIKKNRTVSFFSTASLIVYLIHPLLARVVSLVLKHYHHGAVGVALTLAIWFFVYFLSVLFALYYGKFLNLIRRKHIFCLQ